MQRLIAAVLLIAIAGHANAQAESYPSRPITLVVPFASGGASDIIGRWMATAMQEKLGQPVIVENTAGAGGMYGTNRVVKAASDGYTFIIETSGVNGPTALNSRQMDLISSSLKPIGLFAYEPYLIIGRKNLPANNLKELVQWLKANPFGASSSADIGTHSHVANILFQEATNTKLKLAFYRSEKQSVEDLAAGKIDLVLSSPVISILKLRNGNVKAFAVASKERIGADPDIPTTDEAGLAGFYFSRWYAFWAPRHTPDEIIAKLNKAMAQALDDVGTQRKFAVIGLQSFPREQLTPETLVAYQKAEFDKWLPIIRALRFN